jgi:hypothetical protein
VRTHWLLHQVTLLKMVQNNAPHILLPQGTYFEEKKHPCNGGNPYSDDFHNNVVTRYLPNLPLVSVELMILCQQYAYPCVETCKRYVCQFQEVGYCRPKQVSGNHKALREVRGQSLVNLSLFQLVCSTASLDHAVAFIHNMVPTVGVPFFLMALSCRAPSWLMAKSIINNMPEGIPPFD